MWPDSLPAVEQLSLLRRGRLSVTVLDVDQSPVVAAVLNSVAMNNKMTALITILKVKPRKRRRPCQVRRLK